MAAIQLRYGQGLINLQIPNENLGEVIQPRKQQATKDIVGKIRHALETPMGITLSETITNRRVGILIEDGTRAEPHEIIIAELTRLFNPAKDLTFIITTGSHEPDSARNKEIIDAIHTNCKHNQIDNYHTIVHDALQSSCKLIGTTTRGTKVQVNEEIMNLESFVVAADMKNHYFAGYSNPIKNFMPGICAFRTAEQNHSLALDDRATFALHPWHRDKSRRDNPLASDQLEGMKLTQWCLEPKELSGQFTRTVFSDEFDESALCSEWQWVDPRGDCSYDLASNVSWLEIRPASGSNLHGGNLDAPRLIQEISGEFAIETKMTPGSQEIPTVGGLLVWSDAGNYIRFERGMHRDNEIGLSGNVRGKWEHVGRGMLVSEITYLRLERVDSTFSAYCSSDGENWLTCGQVSFPAEDPVQVGIHAIGGVGVRGGDMATATLFDYFRVLRRES